LLPITASRILKGRGLQNMQAYRVKEIMVKYRYLALAFVPFAILCVFMVKYASNLPSYDRW
jgi:hypothetical protein